MKEHEIQVTETFQRVVKIKADSKEEALEKVENEMNTGEGLTCEDFAGRGFEIIDEDFAGRGFEIIDKEETDLPINLNKSEIFLIETNARLSTTMAQGFAYKKWSKEFTNEEISNFINKIRNSEDFRNFKLDEVRTEILEFLGFLPFNEKLLAVPLWFFILLPKNYELLSGNGFSPEVKMTPVENINNDIRFGCVYAFIEREDIM